MEKKQRIFLVRHGETIWSLSGQHTGRTDIPLTENGKRGAQILGSELKNLPFAKAFVSPLLRASDTFHLSGLSVPFIISDELKEWDYGEYEGLTSKEIRSNNPNWDLFSQGAPGGESIEAIQKRADAVLENARRVQGDVIFFSSGHILRSIAARWLNMPVSFGRHLFLQTCSISILGYEHNHSCIVLWNKTVI